MLEVSNPTRKHYRESLEEFRTPGQSHDESVAALERALGEADDTLGIEYVRLFLDPAGAPCAPWQSAWAPDGRLMGKPHLGALNSYRRNGFAPSLDNEPADHVGLLLLFCSYLLSAEAASQNGGMLSSFAAEHLDWIPHFCALVSANTRLDFYRLMANRTRRLCDEFLQATATSEGGSPS